MQLVKPAIVSVLIAIAGAAAGCVVTPGGTVTYSSSAGIYGGPAANSGSDPIIDQFTPSVNSVDKDGAMTFTVVAHAPSGRPLQFSWSATKGLLSGNTGRVVSWRPLKVDGTLDSGLATITVLVTDGQYTATGTANVMVAPAGTATLVGTSTNATPSTAPSAAASATPTPAASATPTPDASATPTPAASATATPDASASADATATSDATATADAAATH